MMERRQSSQRSAAAAARVAMVVSNPGSDDSRVRKMAEAAQRAGHEVTVFATADERGPMSETLGGVTYRRLRWRSWEEVASGAFLRWPRRLAPAPVELASKAAFVLLRHRLFARRFAPAIAAAAPQLIHAHDLICLPAACVAAAACGASVLYDAHELEADRFPAPPLPLRWHLARLERRWARRADGVVTVGPSIARLLSQRLDRDDVDVVYNSPETAPCDDSLRRQLGLAPDRRLLLYVGKLTVGRGLFDVLPALVRLPELEFALLGPADPRVREAFLARARALGVDARCHVCKPVAPEHVTAFVRDADLGVIGVEPATLSYRYCMPNKLFELAFAGVPIVASRLDDVGAFIGEFDIGELVDFKDTDALAATISRMLAGLDRYRPAASARLRMEAEYGWSAQADRLARRYDALLRAVPVAGRARH